MTRSVRVLLSVVLAAVMGIYLFAPVAGAEERRQCNDIFIREDRGFNPANGVTAGTGTPSDPYVISGCNIGRITIKDTSAAVLITENTIRNQLVLDWIGSNVEVVNNEVGDLRVNQNVRRTGEPTSGLIANNKFGVVGQLRHFDGIFENNVVTGQRPSGFQIPFFQNGQSVNFDGFNGSRFRNNKITGFVTMRLHGHHHSSGFGEGSHYHGADPAAHSGHGVMDHSQRYHRVYFTNNTITSPGPYALNYVDTAHAANDRTAASETNEELNKPHTHYTRVFMNNNRLVGSGLYVNIFNADDERHLGTQTGHLEIRNNTIELVQESGKRPFSHEEPAGISIYRAKDVHVLVADNEITNKDQRSEVDRTQVPFMRPLEIAGIRLYHVEKGQIHLVNNSVSSADFGVWAREMPETTEWWIHDLILKGVAMAVYWDDSVANQPHQD
ncbi:MAG TPA: hypothetical protein VG408_08430 [Actinomycetota bacterium]|nr:hypothetical protein [Actinomycetota bacterium]